MFKHDNFRVDFNTADYSDLTFSPKDREVLRRLAGKIAEIAARPVMDERRKLWFAHNALGKTRPLMRLNSVDLPAPLGPMMATRSPGATARLAPRMISVLPKLLRKSRSSSA